MAHYEIMVMFDTQGNHDAKQIAETVTMVVEKQKGKVTATDDWGERSLAYNLKGRDRANFAVYVVELVEAAVKKVSTQLRLEKEILRFLITKIDK
jgi:small subunit ribosomal protein S6